MPLPTRRREARSTVPIWLTLAIAVVSACSAAAPSTVPSAAPTAVATLEPSPSVAPTASAPPSPAPVGLVLAKADVPRAAASPADAKAAADAIGALAFDLHRGLAADGGNTVFSPTSVAIALAMARAGARGDTATEMDAVLRDVGSDEHAGWLNALDAALAGRTGTVEDDEGTHHELILDIANSYFAQRDLTFEPAFLDALAERFDAGVYQVDYTTDSEAARGLINGWADERTRGRIPEVLLPGDITTATRLALVNAIYLKAPWDHPFEVDETRDAPFTKLDGSTVDVPLMSVPTQIACAEGDGWTAAVIPYLRHTLSMLVIVPDDLPAFEADLSTDVLADVERTIAETQAVSTVAIPRFRTETRKDLKGMLADLGMPAAFDPTTADFSGMTAEEQLYIGMVMHQANISVDEKGTEAAAVTVVGMDTGGGPPDTCTSIADRPFLYLIRDTETGAILFMGRVVDPSA